VEHLLLKIIAGAQNGTVHITVLVASQLILTGSIFKAFCASGKGRHVNARFLYTAPIAFDLVLQILTGATLALSTVLSTEGAVCLAEPLLIGYIFCIQIINSVTSRHNHLIWRRWFRCHVWVLLCASTWSCRLEKSSSWIHHKI
jgi:hypothetical protein